jgi:hypothetical protein
MPVLKLSQITPPLCSAGQMKSGNIYKSTKTNHYILAVFACGDVRVRFIRLEDSNEVYLSDVEKIYIDLGPLKIE